jgi:hypothetical protein
MAWTLFYRDSGYPTQPRVAQPTRVAQRTLGILGALHTTLKGSDKVACGSYATLSGQGLHGGIPVRFDSTFDNVRLSA